MSFKLAVESASFIDLLKSRWKLPDRVGALKIAFAKGLKDISVPLPQQSDSQGAEIPLKAVESVLFDALIRQKFKLKTFESEREKKKYYKVIIDFGALLLKQEYESDIESLLVRVAKEQGTALINGDGATSPTPFLKGSENPINIILGRTDTDEEIIEFWNNKDNTGQHMGITGKTGAGKTQFVLELLTQMYEKSGKQLNIIFFDYAKGDVAANRPFTDGINAEVIDIVRDGVPYNPFYIEDVTNQKIDELKSIFTSVQKGIGSKQSLNLFEILMDVYSKVAEPDLETVYAAINEYYEDWGKSKDILVELFHKLEIPKIFPNAGEKGVFRSLLDKSIVFDLHKMDSHMKVKELVAFLILNKIYTEAIRLPDSKVDSSNNTREMRTVVVIDEAHNYLDCKNHVLEKMLRELRSKGVAVVLLTQGYRDFIQDNFDYSSMLNQIFLMKSDNSKQDIEKALAVTRDKASSIVTKIATAEVGEVFTRKLRAHHKDLTHFTGRMFWTRTK